MNNKIVWKFTNQRELTSLEFKRYFEKKVFATIRKYGMLGKSRVVKIEKKDGLNTRVLGFVLEKKFEVRFVLGNPNSQFGLGDNNALPTYLKLAKTKSLAHPPSTTSNKLAKSKSRSEGFSSVNLSEVAESIFKEVLEGNFSKKGLRPEELKSPLYFLSDVEVELYAKLVGIKGVKRKRDKKIQVLFSRFMKKNPDLERNVVHAFSQLG